MKTVWTVLCVVGSAGVTVGQEEQPGWIEDPDDLQDVCEFLAARDKTWHALFPRTHRFTEWGSRGTISIEWRATVHDGKLDGTFTLYPKDHEPFAPGPGSRRWIRFSGTKWLVVTPHTSGATDKPWVGVLGAVCPSPHWNATMVQKLRRPIMQQSIRRRLEAFPLMRARRSADTIVGEFAVNEPTSKALLERRYEHVAGVIGVRITFTRESDWRPIEVSELYRIPDGLTDPTYAHAARVPFAGTTTLELRKVTWSDWKKVGRVRIPARMEVYNATSPGLDNTYEPKPFSITGSLEVTPLEEVPSTAEFTLVAPAAAGPTGRLSDMDSGETSIVDGRGITARTQSKDSFVRHVVDRAGGVVRRDPSTGKSWTAYMCLLVAVLCGVAILVRPRSRRLEVETCAS